jgi:hypothetical protein
MATETEVPMHHDLIVAPDLLGTGRPKKSWIAHTFDGSVVGIFYVEGKGEAINLMVRLRREQGVMGYGHFAARVHYYLDPEIGPVNFTQVSYAAADLLELVIRRGPSIVSGNELRAGRTLAKHGFARVVARTPEGEETVPYTGRWNWVLEATP